MMMNSKPRSESLIITYQTVISRNYSSSQGIQNG
jgi:hypothetical protein